MASDLIGAHMSIAGGFTRAWDRAQAVGCQALQVFTKNNMQWEASPIKDSLVAAFRERTAALKFPVCGHAGYLINLGAPAGATATRSLKSLIDELERAEALGLPFLVLHPGSHMGQGEETGIKTVAKNLKTVLKNCQAKKVRVALETTAGQGNCLGHRFEHLAEIAEQVGMPSRIGYCFDTCHVFAAGFDISRPRGLATTLKEFDRLLGLENILAFHFNDSKTGLGSRVDRHEHIGKGHIGIEPFKEILNTRAFTKVPKILETPKTDDGRADMNNLKVLRGLIRKT
jgi:deoxyribonuclease IV